MIVIILAEQRPRLINIDYDESHCSIFLSNVEYTTQGNAIYEESWSYSYLVFSDRTDTTSPVRKFVNFHNLNGSTVPLRGTIILVKKRHIGLYDCQQSDCQQIQMMPKTWGETCFVM
jgi:hypothetical protein